MLKVPAPAFVLSLALAGTAATPPPRLSCVLISQGPPCQEFWRADMVFVGLVTEAVGAGWPPNVAGYSEYSKLTARLAVEEPLRGEPGPEVTFVTNDCPYPFRQGERYLVYAHRDRDGRLELRIGHSRTAPLAEAAEDMAYIRGLGRAAAGAGGRIYGTVRGDRSDYRLRTPASTYEPDALAGVRVVAERDGRSYETKTDDKGAFAFDALPAGEYTVRADAPAGRKGREVVRVSLSDHACAPLHIYFMSEGEITGRVLAADGRPVANAAVMLFSAEGATEEALLKLEDAPPTRTYTDKQGRYYLGRLPAGRYYVAASARSGEGESRTYRRALFPAADTLAGATPITLAEGEKRAGADVRLPPP